VQPTPESDPTLQPVDTVLADTGTTHLPTDADVSPTPGELARPAAGGRPGGAGPASFTLALPLRERRVLVVGGGESATRMVTALRASGALVHVVAATLSPQLTELAARGLIEVASRQYQARDLADAWLAFACSDHRSVNAALAFDAEQARIWCVAPEDAARPPLLAPAAPIGRRVLVLGGARSGKSATAEAMLADCPAVDYVATGHLPGNGDAEWDERIRLHRARRPGHWRTVETKDLPSVLAEPEPSPAVLIDCLATWLSQTMDECGLWAACEDADKQLVARQDELVQAWTMTARRVVAVSNEVGSGVVPATASGRRFRDELGWLNARLATAADEVWICTAGIPTRLR
jgi:adenosylcobinamide kinase/adenosylcobinamide-phosphate guanylyltransferase